MISTTMNTSLLLIKKMSPYFPSKNDQILIGFYNSKHLLSLYSVSPEKGYNWNYVWGKNMRKLCFL